MKSIKIQHTGSPGTAALWRARPGTDPLVAGGSHDRPAEKPGPAPEGSFSPPAVESVVQEALVRRLLHVDYDPNRCKLLSQELAATIMEDLKALHPRRYKMVAVVSIGSLTEGQGLQFGSRCLWDDTTDSFACVKFTNGSLFAVAMVYGLYYELK